MFTGSAIGETFYVSQIGTGDGRSVLTPASIADFNMGMLGELDGDTVYFLGKFTTQIQPANVASKVVTLLGNFPGKECTIDGTNSLVSGIHLDGKSNYVIRGFKVQNTTSHCVYIGNSDNVTISNLVISYCGYNNNGYGIFIQGSDHCLIKDSNISYAGRNGISIQPSSSSGTIRDIVVDGNEVSYCLHNGIDFQTRTAYEGNILGIVVRNNNVHHNGDALDDNGIYIYGVTIVFI
jgi:parallel beta-helix repeat protein